MKFIHLGDLHLGKIVNGYNMLEDQAFALDQVLSMAEENGAEAVVLAGDIYDKSTPSAEAVSLFDRFLSALAERNIVVFGVPGNHDSSERIAYANSILRKQGVFFPSLYQGEIESFVLNDPHGPVRFWLMPFLKPVHVRPFFPEEDIEQDYTAAIRCALSTCRVNEAERNVLVAHQFVTACGCATEREESELSLGGLDNVDASVFGKFDYVALGHVHRPQQVGRSTVRYSGSLLKYSFSEARYPKSAVLVDLAAKDPGAEPGACVSFRQVPYPALHDLREIKGPIEDLIRQAGENGDREDYLHVTLTDEHAVLDPMARLRSVYPNIMQLDCERPGQGGPSETKEPETDLEELDPMALFAEFFRDQTGCEMTPEQTRIAQTAMEGAIERHAEGKEGR